MDSSRDQFAMLLDSLCDDANDVAIGLKHEYAGSEHLLAVVCRRADRDVRLLIWARGLTHERILTYLDARWMKSERVLVGPLPRSPVLKKVIADATADVERRTLTGRKVGLLIRLLKCQSPASIASDLGIDVAQLVEELGNLPS